MSPAYDYRCAHCGAVVEIHHSIKVNKRPKCIKCKKVMERLISGGSGILFKGDDWADKKIRREKENRK